jgi:hypothetical protein
VARTSGPTVATAVAAQGPLGHERERAHACDPSPAAGGPSSPAPGPSTPRSHRCRCGRAALCAHGHGGQVRACRVVRARARHACDTFASPAPSRARRLSRADARSSGEGAARPPLCADEAGESWSGRGHRGCTRRCLSRAGVCTSVLGSLTRPAAGAQAICPPLACRRGTVVTCSRAIYSTVAPLQVRACRVVRARARGTGAGVPRCARAGVCTSVLGSLTRPAAGAQAISPLACRRGTVVTCSRAIYSTVAPLQVRACRVVRARARGTGAGVPRCARTGAPCL